MTDRNIRSCEVAGPRTGEVRPQETREDLLRRLLDTVVQAPTKPLAEDVIRGADAIAAEVFGDPKQRRRIYHLCETSQFPHFKLGSVLCARRSVILEWIESQERKNTAGNKE